MNRDVGGVVVEHGTGAVDDFQVGLDLSYDLLLELQRRQGDLDFDECVAVELWLSATRR